MIPSTVAIPAVLPGSLGALGDAAGLLTLLGTVTATVVIGLCVAIARADRRRPVAVQPVVASNATRPALAA